MNFKVKKFVLNSLLVKASNVLSTKDVMPLLRNFYLQIQEKKLKVIGTDLELSIVAATDLIEVVEGGEGSVLFPGKLFFDIVKEAPEGDIGIVVTGDENPRAVITAGSAQWEMNVQSAKDYPAIAELAQANMQKVDKKMFLNCVSRVLHAAARDTLRPALQMIAFDKNYVMATDGAQFHRVSFPLENSLYINIGAVEELLRLLKISESTDFQMGESDTHLLFVVDRDLFVVLKSLHQFPEIDGLVSAAMANEDLITIDKAQAIAAIKRVRVMADSETNALALILSSDNIVFKCKDKYGNLANQSASCYWKGSNRVLGVNCVFLLAVLAELEGANAQILVGKDSKTRKSYLCFKEDKQLAVLAQINVEGIL